MNTAPDSPNDLPLLTLEELREQVRQGESLSIACYTQHAIRPDSPNPLHDMREFSSQEFLVQDGKHFIGRVNRPSPSPLSEEQATIIRSCNVHLHTIRRKCDELLLRLRTKEQELSPSRAYQFYFRTAAEGMRTVCLKTERVIQRIRNELETLFFNMFIRDAFVEEGKIREVTQEAQRQLDQQESIIDGMMQHIGPQPAS